MKSLQPHWPVPTAFCTCRKTGIHSSKRKILIYSVYKKPSVLLLNCRMPWRKLLGIKHIGCRVRRRATRVRHCSQRRSLSKSHMASVKYFHRLIQAHSVYSLVNLDVSCVCSFDWLMQIYGLSFCWVLSICISAFLCFLLICFNIVACFLFLLSKCIVTL